MVSDARRHAVMVPPWVRDALWARARAVPSLDLDFAGSSSLVDRISGQQLITFTRASSATVIGPTGAIETVNNDVPRFQHDPATGRCLGLMVEEQRVNSIRNNTMQGAVAGTPGTLPTNWVVGAAAALTTTVVAVGTASGVNYVDLRVSGTPDSSNYALTFEAVGQVVAASGQSWTASGFLAIIDGSLANISSIALRARAFNAGGGGTEASTGTDRKSVLTATLQRFSESVTLANGTTASINNQLLLGVTAGQAVSITLRIGLPQLEQGAFATSVIPTTGTAATRSADVATITGANFSRWYRQSQGTIYVLTGNGLGAPGFAASVSDGTQPNRITIFRNGSTAGFRHVASNVAANPGDVGFSGGASTPVAFAFAASVGSATAAANGTLSTSSAPAAMPVVDRIAVGLAPALDFALNGTIGRLSYWPTRLNDLALQALTR